jgi:hypothetical protein
MHRCRTVLCAGLALLALAHPARAQDPPPPQQPPTLVTDIRITGAKELSPEAVRRAIHVEIGQPLVDPPDRIAEAVVRRYREDGYTFARPTVTVDQATGVIAIAIDEGVIDAVEFQGVDDNLAMTFAREFALRAGDVFNRARARQALDALLRPSRGAISPGKVYFEDRERRRRGNQETFDLITRNGERVLLVGLRQPAGRFRLVPDLGDREDWFSSVDGFVPSLGFGAAVFDHEKFNHAYVAGHFSVRVASESVGYALGFERPWFNRTKLFVGGELHDLTATDDRWQVSSLEASLAAIGPRKSFRDYYRRRGVQVNAAVRAHPQVDLLFAFRTERQEPLPVQTDFSLWNSDEPFRPNRAATDGHLNALIVGASYSSDNFDRESLDATYRRHQLEEPFGERLADFDRSHNPEPIFRVDWSSEISAPDAFGSDFDFSRHIVTARTRMQLSPHQTFGARGILGWSGGSLPPQRQFAIGGIGSVHGYEFKEAIGSTLTLANLEYGLGWRNEFEVIGFFDTGRASDPNPLFNPATNGRWLNGIGFGFGFGGLRVDFGYKLDDIPSSLQVLLRFGRTF